jgi:hypothetical protein
MTSPIIYAYCVPSCKWSDRPRNRGFVVSCVHGAAIMPFSSSALELNWTSYTRLHTFSKIVDQRSEVRWPRWPSNRTLSPNPTVLKILPEKCSYLSTRTRGCAILLQTRLSPDVQRNIWHWQLIFQETEVALGYQALFKYKRPDDLASKNTAPNVNREDGSENVFLCKREDYRVFRHVSSVHKSFRLCWT